MYPRHLVIRRCSNMPDQTSTRLITSQIIEVFDDLIMPHLGGHPSWAMTRITCRCMGDRHWWSPATRFRPSERDVCWLGLVKDVGALEVCYHPSQGKYWQQRAREFKTHDDIEMMEWLVPHKCISWAPYSFEHALSENWSVTFREQIVEPAVMLNMERWIDATRIMWFEHMTDWNLVRVLLTSQLDSEAKTALIDIGLDEWHDDKDRQSRFIANCIEWLAQVGDGSTLRALQSNPLYSIDMRTHKCDSFGIQDMETYIMLLQKYGDTFVNCVNFKFETVDMVRHLYEHWSDYHDGVCPVHVLCASAVENASVPPDVLEYIISKLSTYDLGHAGLFRTTIQNCDLVKLKILVNANAISTYADQLEDTLSQLVAGKYPEDMIVSMVEYLYTLGIAPIADSLELACFNQAKSSLFVCAVRLGIHASVLTSKLQKTWHLQAPGYNEYIDDSGVMPVEWGPTTVERRDRYINSYRKLSSM